MTRPAVAAVALTLALGCREREVALDAGVAPAVKPSQARILHPAAPASFVDLVDRARHGVVAIRASAPVKSGPAAMFPGAPDSAADVALGTGFLVEAEGVHVVTTDRVAAAATELRVVLPGGDEVPAKVIGRDVRLDLALLAIDVPRLSPLPLGDSESLRVGEWIVVLGNAFGDEVSVTAGVVSATGRDAAASLVPGRAMGFRTFLQTDARIHRGNSGGPVLDTAGRVIGVAVATSDRVGELSFVIPIDRVKEVLGPLRQFGTVARSWLGVLAAQVTETHAKTIGLAAPTGALVTEIKPGSPAARSTLRPGDVILKWDDRDVDHRSLPWIVSSTPVGKAITLQVWRSGAQVPVTLVTEKMPE